MSFFDLSEEDLDLAPIYFNASEVVEFVILDHNDTSKQALILNCRVLSGENEGKKHTIFLDKRDNKYSKEIRVQFSLTFWTREEILAKENGPSKLTNRKFSAVAQAVREHEGKKYQSFSRFVDLGEYLDPDAASFSGADHTESPRF